MDTNAIYIPLQNPTKEVVSKSNKKNISNAVMNSDSLVIDAPYGSEELTGKLKNMTVSDFDQIRQSPNAVYCGEVSSHSFNIRHVRYSPMSHAPHIQGEIIESVNNQTTIKVEMDTKEPFELVRKMYYGTLLPIGVIVMLLSVLVMWNTAFQWQSLILSSSFILIAFLAVALHKSLLLNTKKNELNAFVSRIDGRIIISE